MVFDFRFLVLASKFRFLVLVSNFRFPFPKSKATLGATFRFSLPKSRDHFRFSALVSNFRCLISRLLVLASTFRFSFPDFRNHFRFPAFGSRLWLPTGFRSSLPVSGFGFPLPISGWGFLFSEFTSVFGFPFSCFQPRSPVHSPFVARSLRFGTVSFRVIRSEGIVPPSDSS